VLTLYPRTETAFTSNGLAIFNLLLQTSRHENIKRYHRLDGEQTLHFVVPYDTQSALIQSDCFIKYDGHIFIVRELEEIRDSEGLVVSVFCEHIISELIDGYVPEQTLTNVTLQNALNTLLAGTRFAATVSSVSGAKTIDLAEGTTLSAIRQLLNTFKAEMSCAGLPSPSNFALTVQPQIGSNNGVQIRYRKNLLSSRRKTDAKSVITRLYCYGKDDISIESITGDRPYIDSQYINSYQRPKVGVLRLTDITSPAELHQAGLDYLAEHEVERITYDFDVVDLKNVEVIQGQTYGEFERFGVGDTVRVIDEELGINVTARVVEVEQYPLDERKNRVVLANFVQTIIDNVNKVQVLETFQNNVQHKGKLNTTQLTGTINALQNGIKGSGAFQNATVQQDKGILLENTKTDSDDYGALYLGTNLFAIASDKVNGDWNWRTFGTGKGFKADEITTGTLRAELTLADGLLTKILNAQNAYIANLTVSELETNKFVENYLASDTSAVEYTKIQGQDIKMILAVVKNLNGQPLTKQLKNKNNQNMYWTDNTKTVMTINVTAHPIIIYEYELREKIRLHFYKAGSPANYYPEFIIGEGDGATEESGKAFLQKGDAFVQLFYKTRVTDLVRSIGWSDDTTSLRYQREGDFSHRFKFKDDRMLLTYDNESGDTETGKCNLWFASDKISLSYKKQNNTYHKMIIDDTSITFDAPVSFVNQNVDFTGATVTGLAGGGTNSPLTIVRRATTENVNLESFANTFDGGALSNGNKLLVKNQSDATENGIYTYNSSAQTLTRSGSITPSMLIFVQLGDLYAKNLFVNANTGIITIGTTSITFEQIVTNAVFL